MIFETHAHYDDESFDPDREELLSSLPEHGITRVINVCADPASLKTTPELTERYPFVYGAVGIHPDYAGEMDAVLLERIRTLACLPKTVAIGEIGLDYYVPAWAKEDGGYESRREESRTQQIFWFEQQLTLAREEHLPVIIHSRDAAEDTLEIAKRMDLGGIGGVVHCFSYSREIAREYLNMGMYLGIGGVITFKNARKLREIAAYAPLSALLLETDSPYLSPEPNRGKRNSSLNLPWVAREIARVRGITEEEVIAVTEQNAQRLFFPLQ